MSAEAISTRTLPERNEERAAEPEIDAGGASHVGQRRSANEDTYLIASLHRSMHVVDGTEHVRPGAWSLGRGYGTLLMVADGMGGHGGGDIASQSAVDAIANYLINVLPCATTMVESLPDDTRSSLHGLRGKLSSALLVGDQAIRIRSKSSTAHDMGTTLTMAFIAWPSLYVAHVGDSRCYLFREGRLTQLTNDHTVANQIAKMGGDNTSESSQLNHILWNCLGGGDDSRPTPEVLKYTLSAGDAVFLCTDGLTNELQEAEIARELSSNATSKEICQRLIDLANEHGGEDNITAVLARAGQARPT